MMPPSPYNLVRYFVRTSFFVASNIYAFLAYIVWMTVLTPLRLLVPSVYWKIENELFYMLETVCLTWIDSGGYKVMECGDDVSLLQDQECLLLSNHQSTADVPLIMLILHNFKKAACKVMWIIFRPYIYSNFGIVCWHREDFFIDSGGKTMRDKESDRLKNHLTKSFVNLKKWIVLFPEGGFLSRQKERNQIYAKKNNLPETQHVLLPRATGVKIVLDTVAERYREVSGHASSSVDENGNVDSSNVLNGQNGHANGSVDGDPSRPLKWVIDMTIAYKDKEPLELAGIAVGYEDTSKHVLVHWRVHRAQDIPRDEASLTSWLYARYLEKEKMLDDYYKEGKIPGPSGNTQLPHKEPRFYKYDLIYQFMANTALIVLCYLEYALLFKPFAVFIAYLWCSVF